MNSIVIEALGDGAPSKEFEAGNYLWDVFFPFDPLPQRILKKSLKTSSDTNSPAFYLSDCLFPKSSRHFKATTATN